MGPLDLNFGGGFSPLGSLNGADLLTGAGGLLGELNPFPEFSGAGFSGYSFPDFSLFQSAAFRLPTLFSFDSPELQMPRFFQPIWHGFSGASYFGGFSPSFRFIANGTHRSNPVAEDSPLDLPSGVESDIPPAESPATEEVTPPVEPVAPTVETPAPLSTTSPSPTPPALPVVAPEKTAPPPPVMTPPPPSVPASEEKTSPSTPPSDTEGGMEFELMDVDNAADKPAPTTPSPAKINQLEKDLKKPNQKIEKENAQYAKALNKAYKAAGYSFDMPEKKLEWCRENKINPKNAKYVFMDWYFLDIYDNRAKKMGEKLNNLGLVWNDKPDLGVDALFPTLTVANRDEIIAMGEQMDLIFMGTHEPDEINVAPFMPDQKQKAQRLFEKADRYTTAIDKMKKLIANRPATPQTPAQPTIPTLAPERLAPPTEPLAAKTELIFEEIDIYGKDGKIIF